MSGLYSTTVAGLTVPSGSKTLVLPAGSPATTWAFVTTNPGSTVQPLPS